MGLSVSVKGGTGAGKRRVKPSQSREDWVCPVHEGGCGKAIPYYYTRCPNCGHARPERR